MSETLLSRTGYVCAPYLHNHESINLKEEWTNSKNIENMYFATATFSNDSKPYFLESSNHYLLAKFNDDQTIHSKIKNHLQDKISFIFNIENDLFQREVWGKMNFISIYYLEYNESEEDFGEIASILAKRDKVGRAGIGNMNIYCKIPPKFTFPYSGNIVVLEVSSEKSHQSVNKYCEATRKDVSRKGLTMTSLMSLSILEKLK
ncbi:MAG: hypothetical protein GWN01_03900 [Nitrosopumilaceae archaeon]|nr:hypothetical protein [Nitrosopumilaceae archaeon]NIU00098.1 hypothetical protein [Nitrosopumilaceae archaeon]NIU86488.1 hypothetical protein [Nitrosopumilaceae archaeon]NIV65723.1 hypothetical protein [Nitrosopumilaceae archaeon]NIX60700.1 hypothetical protein [Nitrosopumilaceae archaeon]